MQSGVRAEPLISAFNGWGHFSVGPTQELEMKVLVAAIALLCVSNTVFAHDIYSNLRDKAGRYCCNGQDCRPVQVTVLPNGSYYLPTTNEIIPADRATPSPDDRFHHCT